MKHRDAITHTFAWQIDKGKLRKRNEDSLGASKIKIVTENARRSIGVYMVADGIGGMEAGQEASKLAIQTAMHEMMTAINSHDETKDVSNWLQDAAKMAHRQLRLRQNYNDSQGTTLVMAAVIENEVHIVNIGDSRAYLIHDGTMRQITRDHTVAQKFAEAGVIPQEDVDNHPYRNVLSQAVGLDMRDGDTYREEVEVGDHLLLCSDGLHSYVEADEILRIINESESPKLASKALINAANNAGGKDNIAVIVIASARRITKNR
jgi:protein phosphatase